MARPRLPVGSNGSISVKEVTPGVWRAITRYRFNDGRFKQVERRAASKSKAVKALKKALQTIDTGGSGNISSDMRLSVLADRFMADKRERRSVGTIQSYEPAIEAHIKPGVGELSIREATPERLNGFLMRIARENGHGAASMCRSVLSGMMSIAVRNGAIPHNPVVEVEPIEKHGRPGSTPIPPDRLGAFLKALEADDTMRNGDYVELLKFMAGTGWRIGEACGLCWDSVDFEHGTVTMRRIARYVKRTGPRLQEYGKTTSSVRTIKAPASVMLMLRRRLEREPDNALGLVFPSRRGLLRDPTNVERVLRARRDAMGFPGVTSHSLRKCVATMLDAQGLSARAIADYLGHRNPSMTQDVYMQRNLDSTVAAGKLQERLSTIME